MDWEWEHLDPKSSAPHLLEESCDTGHFHLLKTQFSHLSNGHNHAAPSGASERALQTVKDGASSLVKLLSSLA